MRRRPELVLRGLRDARTRTLAFGAFFLLIAYTQTVAYRDTYPTVASRLAFARGFAHNKAVVLFYGKAFTLLTPGGYVAWRVGGTLALGAAAFGILAAVRALRAEEDSGRSELVLATAVSRGGLLRSALVAVGLQATVLAVAEFAGLLAGKLAVGSSLLLILATMSVTLVFAGLGALACELAPTRRVALELGGAAFALFFALRVIADTVGGLGALRWLTPLGWAENVRPFTSAQPLVLALPLSCATALLLGVWRLGVGRDVGTGLLPAREGRPAQTRLLGSPTGLALRLQRGGLLAWTAGAGTLALVTGLISNSTGSGAISPALRREFAKFGVGSIATPSGYLSLTFEFFVFAIGLFAVAQVAAVRHEEADEQLETLLALPLRRGDWLASRVALSLGVAVALSGLSSLLCWAGARAAGASVSLPGLLEAGVNCAAVGLLFLGLGTLLYGALPRAATGLGYALVVAAFLWQLIGSLLQIPAWVKNLTPFAHLGLAPAQAFRPVVAAILVGAGIAAAGAGVALFARRDLVV